MWYWLLGTNLLLAIAMVILGDQFLKSAPKKINRYFGYRTARSMRNRDTWQYAHAVCGLFVRRCESVMLGVSVVAMLCVLKSSQQVVAIVGYVLLGLQLLVLILAIPHTEKALRRTFNQLGVRMRMEER